MNVQPGCVDIALVRSSVFAVLQSDSWPICEKAIFTSANAADAVKRTAMVSISASELPPLKEAWAS